MIVFTDQRCQECKVKLSEYEAEEYKGHCIDCWQEIFKEE